MLPSTLRLKTSQLFIAALMLTAGALPAYAVSATDIVAAVNANQFSRAIQLAESAGNPLLTRYANWAAITDEHAGTASFYSTFALLPHVREWPMFNSVRIKAEQAALLEAPDTQTMLKFCKNYPPISGRGMLACARAGVGTAQQQSQWIAQGWKQGDFTRDEERNVAASFGGQLTLVDHRARIDRLLYEGKTSAASNLLWRLPDSERRVAEARIALRNNARDANARLARVPASALNTPGLIFERIVWRHGRSMADGVISLFVSAPDAGAQGDVWWPLRANYVRKAMHMGQYQTAMQILDKHGTLKREFLAEALWMKGWLYYDYLRDTGAAYKAFYQLYKTVQFPVSKARAAYWAARAATRNNNADIAKNWLSRAARYPTVFYGQLAHSELTPNAPLKLPASVGFSAEEKAAFDKEESVRLITLLARSGGEETADRFIVSLAEATTQPSRLALLANLARAVGQSYDAVKVAKIALRSNTVLMEQGWPTIQIPPGLAIEPALTLAIIRQESEFNPHAVSPANARGYMQLLPTTAQETARKIGVAYSYARLFEQAFNLQVGSEYLGRMIQAYDGSFIAGIASYNAGPGNVRKWYRQFGNPGGSVENSVKWMESIPFAETRNYVQRVLENLQIYRARLGQKVATPLVQDLTR